PARAAAAPPARRRRRRCPPAASAAPAARARHAPARRTAPRRRAAGGPAWPARRWSVSWSETPQELFQDDAGGARIRVACAFGGGLGAAVALIHLEDRQAEAPAQLAREAQRALGHLVRGAVRVARHAHHQRVG